MNRELDERQFSNLRRSYWVLAFKGETASFWKWHFGVGDPPPPVPNRSMEWRRPTYEEAVERQQRFEDDPPKFNGLCQEWSDRNRWTWRYGIRRSGLRSRKFLIWDPEDYLERKAPKREPFLRLTTTRA